MSDHDCELEVKVALVEERMETLKADLAATLEGFRTDMAEYKADAAKRDLERMERDKSERRHQTATIIGMLGLIIAGGTALLTLLTIG